MNTIRKKLLIASVCALCVAPLVAKSGQCFVVKDVKIKYKECLCKCEQEQKFSSGKCKRCEHFRKPLKLLMDMRKFKLHKETKTAKG